MHDPSIDRFVERFGAYFSVMGISRSAGQILAWLLVSEQPQSLDDLVRALHISKASASLGTRMWEQFGLIDRVHRRGDRKTYYQIRPNLPRVMADTAVAKYQQLLDLVYEGQKAVGDSRPKARAVLEEFARVYRHLIERVPELLAELEEEKGSHGAPRA